MKVLIIGLGSIAQKHIYALNALYSDVRLYALRSGKNASEQHAVENIYSWEDIPEGLDFILISNPTSEHAATIYRAIDYNVPLFIEKPSLSELDPADELIAGIRKNGITTFVAFTLRFHPVINWLKQHLETKRVLQVQTYCGSYLPDWRPDLDYRTVYSAVKELGGGVHLDLIHELDYITWLFGYPQRSFSVNKRVSKLEITSSDYAHYLLDYPEMAATVTLNYFRRKPVRQMEIVFDDDIWQIDLLKNEIKDQHECTVFASDEEPIAMYIAQMRYFVDCIQQNVKPMNSFEDSVETLKICLS